MIKIFRWKALIPIVLITTLFFIFTVFFREKIIKDVLISTGQLIFGAKVEIHQLKTGLLKPDIEINKIYIADKNEPFKNFFEVENIKFKLRLLPLLSKKIIVDDITLEGIKWSTDRKSSGALPPKKVKKIEKKTDSFSGKLYRAIKNKVSQELKALPVNQLDENIKEAINSFQPQDLVRKKELESKKIIEFLNKDSIEKYNYFIKTGYELNIEEEIKKSKELIERTKNLKIAGLQDVQILKEHLEELNKQKEKLEIISAKIKILEKNISSEFKQKSALALEIDDKIKQDYENIVSEIKIPGLKKIDLSKEIFGSVWLNRVNTVMHYIDIARRYMPSRKKTDIKLSFPRIKGEDVVFYKKEVLPGLLIKKIIISGTTGGPGKDNINAFDLKGSVFDICSDQKITGKPAIIYIAGKKGIRNYNFEAIFDHTQEIPYDKISINMSNMSLDKDSFIGKSIPSFEKGDMNFSSNYQISGDTFDLKMEIVIKNTEFKTTDENNELSKVICEILKEIKEIRFTARMSGTSDNIKNEIDSNIDDIITQRLNSIYSKKITEIKEKLKKEIENQINSERTKLYTEYENRKTELLNLCSLNAKLLNEEKEKIENNLNDIKKEINKTGEDKKKEVEKEIKEKIAPELQKLFKK